GPGFTGGRDLAAFIVCYDRGGRRRWVRVLAGPRMAWAATPAVTPDGHVYVTGVVEGDVELGPGPDAHKLPSRPAGMNTFLLHLDSEGKLRWATVLAGTGPNRGGGVAVDRRGNVYASGTFSGTLDFDPDGRGRKLTS